MPVDMGAELSLKGLTDFVSGLRKAGGAGAGAAKKIGRVGKVTKSLKRVGRGAAAVGRGMVSMAKIGGMAAGVLGATIAGATAKYGTYEKQIARIGTLLEPGADAMATFGDVVTRNSVKYGQAAEQSADAVFQAISAGIDPSKKSIESFSKVVGEAGVGGFVDMATVVDGLTTVMNTYGLDVEKARQVSDDFFIANKLGKTTFVEISKTIGGVAPTARALGVSYKEVLAATISMTKGGIATSEAMTGLKAIFSSIAKPTREAEGLAKKLGLQFNLAGLQTRGFSGFLEDLVAKTKGNTIAQNALFGSTEAFNAIAKMASAEGVRDFTNAMDALKNSAGATKQAFEVVSQTTGFRIDQMKQGFSALVRELGGGISEGLGLDKIANIPDAVAGASETIRGSASAFAVAFKEAFAPVKAMGEVNFKGMAKSMGGAAAQLANAFVKALKLIPSVVEGLAKIAQGVGAVVGVVRELAGDDTSPGTALVAGSKGKITEVKDFKRFQRNLTRETAQRRAFRERKAREAMLRSAAAGGYQAPPSPARGPQSVADWTRRYKARRLAAKIAAAPTIEAPVTNVVVNLKNETNIDSKKKGGGGGRRGGRFSTRGRGDATITSTVRTRYLLYENEAVPVSDEFTYGHLLAEGQV